MKLFELALSLEEELQNYYRKQAELNAGKSLGKVFSLLEKEEAKHAEILKAYADDIILPLNESDILSEVRSVFSEMDDYKSDNNTSQLDVYRFALEKEEESLRFYRDLQQKATDNQSKTVFNYLVKQEDTHIIIMEELVKLVNRPKEWVESAEFGLREDY